MTIAEALYTKGYISYPRTETEAFSEGTDLMYDLFLTRFERSK